MKHDVDILIVDDETVIVDAIAKACKMEKLTTRSASDARQALALLSDIRFRLIISDILMPGMDGFEFLAALMHRRIGAPVIMTTGYSTVENAIRSLYDGAIDFLAKPFTIDELLSCIMRGIRLIELREMQRHHTQDIVFVPCPPKYMKLGYGSWVTVERDGTARTGMTDLFLKTIDAMGRLKPMSVGDEVVQGSPYAWLSADGSLEHQILCPLSGRIVSVNTALWTKPNLLQKDPFFEGWLYTLIPSDASYESQFLVSCSSDEFSLQSIIYN